VIDGNLYPFPDNIKLDCNCTIKNYPEGMSTNFSFDNNDPTPYLIIFDNVLHTGQMACNSVAGHTIWFVNGSSTSIQEGCQNLLIPVEKIDKQSPAPFAAIGVPFTYTLTIPVLYDAATGTIINSSGSVNDLHSIILTDDLNATGAAITYISHVAYWQGSSIPVTPTFSNASGVLTFNFNDLPIIPAEQQIVLEITVVLNDTPANVPGTVFTNTAKWSFGRLIDGVYYEPLPGEWGISDPMIIVGPDLVVTKTSSETALNLGDTAIYTIDAQNTGGGAAWNTTILDEIPVGMCEHNPTTAPGVSAQIFEADGITPVSGPLVQGTDYSVTYRDRAFSAPDHHLPVSAGCRNYARRLSPYQRCRRYPMVQWRQQLRRSPPIRQDAHRRHTGRRGFPGQRDGHDGAGRLLLSKDRGESDQ
jgi:uncharacterized repeat protein (TIGR01451 family)